jgi:hypothetical protein
VSALNAELVIENITSDTIRVLTPLKESIKVTFLRLGSLRFDENYSDRR